MGMYKKAERKDTKLKMSIIGPSGSGKTFTALTIARELGDKIAVIDTESGSASKYDEFGFDVCELEKYDPKNYIEAIDGAMDSGYDYLIIDSLTHCWYRCLELHSQVVARQKTSNAYIAWDKITPVWTKFIQKIVQSKINMICTMRTKTEYVLELNDRGKQVPKKVGLAPIIRSGSEYEFDIVGVLSIDHEMVIEKTRCQALDGKVFDKPGKDISNIIKKWIKGGKTPDPIKKEAEPEFEKPKVEPEQSEEQKDDFDIIFQRVIDVYKENDIDKDILSEYLEVKSKQRLPLLDFDLDMLKDLLKFQEKLIPLIKKWTQK